jgi:hypothetical protein
MPTEEPMREQALNVITTGPLSDADLRRMNRWSTIRVIPGSAARQRADRAVSRLDLVAARQHGRNLADAIAVAATIASLFAALAALW